MHHNDVGIDISRWPVGRAGKGVQKLALTHTHTHTHALVILVQVDEVDTHVDARLKDPVNQYPAILGERHPGFRRDDYASFNLVPRSCCLVIVLCVCVWVPDNWIMCRAGMAQQLRSMRGNVETVRSCQTTTHSSPRHLPRRINSVLRIG